MNIKIGCDPELFIKDKKTNKYVSAAGFFPGTKKEPYKVDKGAIQVDGVALEFNIDAASSEDEFFKNTKTVMDQMTEMVSKVNKDWELCITPIANFTKKDWDEIPDEAKILGCDPDFAYNGVVNPNPGVNLLKRPIRTASGHIHIGWTEGEDVTNVMHFEDARFMAYQFHFNYIFQPTYREETARLRWYGMNGSFRPKPYGVELRSPSNMWLLTETKIRETFRKTKTNFDRFASMNQ